MSKILFEFEDLPWFPQLLRGYMTDYLQFIFTKFNMYEPVVHELQKLIEKRSSTAIVDLCSGSGGPVISIQNAFLKYYNKHIPIILTDKFIPAEIIKLLPKGITYHKDPVDAKSIPKGLKGLRTMFSSLHHFTAEEIKLIISNSSLSSEPFAFFDSGNKSILMILSIIVFHPILMFLFTPFIKPFSLGRVLFTYLIPLVMFFTIWDGIISILNLHSKKNINNLISQLSQTGINCHIVVLKNKLGMKIVGISG